MIWQDIVITITSIIFAASLVPQVYYGFRKKKGLIRYSTSVPTSLCLYVTAFVYFTLSLYVSTIISVITASLWLTLFIQKLVYKEE